MNSRFSPDPGNSAERNLRPPIPTQSRSMSSVALGSALRRIYMTRKTAEAESVKKIQPMNLTRNIENRSKANRGSGCCVKRSPAGGEERHPFSLGRASSTLVRTFFVYYCYMLLLASFKGIRTSATAAFRLRQSWLQHRSCHDTLRRIPRSSIAKHAAVCNLHTWR